MRFGKKIEVNLDHIRRLWDLFVMSPLIRKDTIRFYNWMQNGISGNQRGFFNLRLVEDIFFNLFNENQTFDIIEVTEEGYECF